MNVKKNLLAFVIGSSLLVSFATFTYNGLAYRKNPTPKVPYELFPIFIPLLFGIANVILYNLVKYTKTQNAFWLTLLVGALTGLTFSVIGRFGLNIPGLLYKMPSSTHYTVHITAFFLYMLIFAVVVYPLNKYLLFNN